MQQGLNLLKECLVQLLCNAILGGGVMHSEYVHSSCSLQVHLELLTHILSTMVSVQLPDVCIHLCLAPCLILLVGSENFTFLAQQIKMSEASKVISECQIISVVSQHLDWGWSPHITVDLLTECLCVVLWIALLWYRLVCSLHIGAGLTKSRFLPIQLHIDTTDKSICYKPLCSTWHDVLHVLMQPHNGEL